MAKSNASAPKNPRKIYLDHASATPVDPGAARIMHRVSEAFFANPSAIHEDGVAVKNALAAVRAAVAEPLGAHSDEIIFTSGATESNNLAITGIVNASQDENFFRGSARPFKNSHFVPHIITTNIEHASVLEACKYLEKTKQAQVTYVPVEPNGIVDAKKIKKALKKNTVLVSVMYANNEIGTIQPLREIAKEIRHFRKDSKNSALPYFHTDATQATNYLSMNAEKLGVDLLSFNAAKIYGPKGIGALWKKRSISLAPIMHGGDQEYGLRSGTENIVAVSGFAEALAVAEDMKVKEVKRLTVLRDYFIKKLQALDKRIILNGDAESRLPNNVNITSANMPSDLLIIELSARGIMASAKSACKSGDGKASHVIAAIRPDARELDGSLRFTLGRGTTKADIDHTAKALEQILNKLKKWYN
ncbi:MAG: cysteine desulfurase family protein [bacterium]